MDKSEIDLRELRRAVDMILDHVIEDLNISKVVIKNTEDFFWDCPPKAMYDMSKKPAEWWTGRLSDDLEFIQKMLVREDGGVAFMLIHAAPLLRYIGQNVRECAAPEEARSPKPQ
jgi:hypothetical protein